MPTHPRFRFADKSKNTKNTKKRKRMWTRTDWIVYGVSLLVVMLSCLGFFFLGRASVHAPTLQVVDIHSGEWVKLDLSKHPLYSLFCGSPAGGYACAVNRIQDNVDKDAGAGILLVPYVAGLPDVGAIPSTPPAGGPSAPEQKQKEREHSDSFETRRLRASK
jgi:hypothetical protein